MSRKVVRFDMEIPIPNLERNIFQTESEILRAVKPFFILTRSFGLHNLEIEDRPGHNVERVKVGELRSFTNSWRVLLLINQVFLLINQLAKGEDFVKKSGPFILLRIHLTLVYLWGWALTHQLVSALNQSPYVESRLLYYQTEDLGKMLSRKCLIVTIGYSVISLGQAVTTFVIPFLFPLSSGLEERLKNYGHLTCGIGGNDSLASAYCTFDTFLLGFIWIFPDFLLLILSVTMEHFFTRLTKAIKATDPRRLTTVEIDILRERHGMISKLVNKFDDGIWSLNLINMIFNIAFLMIGSYSLLSLKNRERISMGTGINQLISNLVFLLFKSIVGLVGASVLHRRENNSGLCQAHEAILEIRSWPMSQNFTINNGRTSVIHSFLAQLSSPNIGFTMGKLVTITGKLLVLLVVGAGSFFTFARIIITSCSRGS